MSSPVLVALAVLAAGGEAALAAAAVSRLADPAILLAAHLALSLLLFAAAAQLRRPGGWDPALLLLVIATPTMGPFGAVGAALGIGLRALFALRAVPFETWYASLVPTLETIPSRLLYERLVLRSGQPAGRSTVASFGDVMALGTVGQKLVVLTAIADNFRPEFAASLAAALNNTEPAVRVQAATVLARLEQQFLERSLHLAERRAAAPEDPDLLLALARLHDEWADTGLLDAGRVRREREHALDAYRRLQALGPRTPEVSAAIGRLLLRLDQPEAALPDLEAAVSCPGPDPAALALHMECLYRLGRHARLRRSAASHWPGIAASDLPDAIREAVRLWAGAVPRHATLGPTP